LAADALAREIIHEHIDTLVPTEAVEAGVQAAIEEIDDATFDFAVDVIRDRVIAEVEGQAKAIALRMLRETAAKAERAAAACSVVGGI
jgi:DNA-binding FrmR family transcriptional regulator